MRRPLLTLLLLAAALLPATAGETATSADRQRLARGMYRHDFENRRHPDTGSLLPESADMDLDGWPDFWEAVRTAGFPEYLVNTVTITTDRSGLIPGAYRDEDNHVLRLGFDGTRLGLRTRTPVPVDPALAYEFAILHRASGMAGGRIRAGVDWMRIDPAATQVLRSDSTVLSNGQVGWPAAPARLLVNDPPSTANAARLFILLDRAPGSIDGAYHGEVWIDEIALRPLPKILVAPPRPAPSGTGRVIPILYDGLFDNIADPANPGYFKGKRYHRRIEVSDVFDRAVDLALPERAPVLAGDDGKATEEIAFPLGEYGAYYFNIRLYDADDRLAASVVRAVAVMPPAPKTGDLTARSNSPAFGVRTGPIPEVVLTAPGFLHRAVAASGAGLVKITPWPEEYAAAGSMPAYARLLAEEIRGLRSAGLGLTGVVAPPAAMPGAGDFARSAAAAPDELAALIEEAGARFGLFMDAWQWADDDDAGFTGFADPAVMDALRERLSSFAGGLPQVLSRRADRQPAPFPFRPDRANLFVPATRPVEAVWPDAALAFPWLFEPYYRLRGARYPPARLAGLAPAPAADAVERQNRNAMRTGTSLSLETTAAEANEPSASSERTQMEQLLIRAVYAAAAAPDAVYLGVLFDDGRGLLRRDAAGGITLETMARPALLAARTASELLAGAEYLGELGLLPPYEAHVFRAPGVDAAIIALWHNEAGGVRTLSRAEIGNGLPLSLVDWAGNRSPLPPAIPVRRTPAFILGMPASLALTRMSVRIAPEPPLLAQNRTQGQMLEVVNHLPRQAPVMFRTRFAARYPDGAMENGWTAAPDELRINLAPATPDFQSGRLRFSVSPDPNSQIQKAGPGGADKSGTKIARVVMGVQSSPPADMLLYLPFSLRSELDVDIEPLPRVDDPNFVTLLLKIRWFPPPGGRRTGEIRLLPYHGKLGRMRETAAFPVTVKALPPELRGAPDAPYESVELRIPRLPAARTWVGLEENGGSSFYLADVTDFLSAP